MARRHDKAIRHLCEADPVLAKVIDTVGKCGLQRHADGEHLHALVRTIVYQQLSGKAAATIHSRVLALFEDEYPTPEQILAAPDSDLRGAGLSRQKISYLRDLASKVAAGYLPLDDIESMEDTEIENALVGVKGIGKWTAQMFLMFRLGRADVLPDGDLGVQKGVKRAYGLRAHPSPARVRKIGAKWSPYASVASWYMWRILETPEEKPRALRAKKK